MAPTWSRFGKGATLERGAVFSLIIMFRTFLGKNSGKKKWHQDSVKGGAELPTMKRLQGAFWLHHFLSVAFHA